MRELNLAGVLSVDGLGNFHLTEKQKKILQRMERQKEKEKEKEDNFAPLLKRIDNIKDEKKRQRALKLLDRLFNLLPDEE